MKKIIKKMVLVMISILLCACGSSNSSSSSQSETSDIPENIVENSATEDEPAKMDDIYQELEVAKKSTIELPSSAKDLQALITSIETMRNEGYELMEAGMSRQASYCLSYAGGSISALRYACELLADVSPSGFQDWDTIGAINFTTPIPYYCEAITSKDEERVKECHELANYTLQEIKEADNISLLKDLSKEDLQLLIDEFKTFESEVYWFYPADPIARERTGLEWSAEYHLVLAGSFEELEMNKEAIDAYMDALACDPFNPDLYAMCAKGMYYNGDIQLMQTYIEEGLLVDPKHDLLNALGALLYCAAGEKEQAKSYLKQAKAAKSKNEEVLNIIEKVEIALKG